MGETEFQKLHGTCCILASALLLEALYEYCYFWNAYWTLAILVSVFVSCTYVLLFCGNFSHVQPLLGQGQGRLDKFFHAVNFTSYGNKTWKQTNFQAVFKSLGSAWQDKLYIKYLMLSDTNLSTKKLVDQTMLYFRWEREKRCTKPLFHPVFLSDMHCSSRSIYLLSFNRHCMIYYNMLSLHMFRFWTLFT
jgi:hypothetical protein